MHVSFCIILKSHFFICDFIDIDECKGNHSCHEDANCTNTNGSHVCDCQPGYTGNGQNCTGEFRITRKCGHRCLILVRSFFCCLYNVFCAPVAKQEQFMAYALDDLCCTNVKKKLQNSALTYRSNPRIAWNQKVANKYSTFFIYTYMYDFWIKTKSHFHYFLFLLNVFVLTDIDECHTYPDKCHVNALCKNTHGSHVCTCKPGYTGDGRNCTGTVNNLRSLHIRFDYCNEFLFVVVVFFKARKKWLEHERNVGRNTRGSREAFASLLTLW